MELGDLDLANLARICAVIHAQADEVDARALLPLDGIQALHAGGLLPTGMCSVNGADEQLKLSAGGVQRLQLLLTSIGAASLTVGRLYEGHINAIRLIELYGETHSRQVLSDEISAGRLLGVWNAEREGGPTLTPCQGGWHLSGRKIHCSGAGHILRPIVTARDGEGQVVMLLPDIRDRGVEIDVSVWRATGMRGTATATVDFHHVFVSHKMAVGSGGDYYRSPFFSGGAWRVLAVQLGGLQAILALHKTRLIASGRNADPIFRARFAEAAADFECARLLVTEASQRAENLDNEPAAIDAYVNQARAQFERLALSGIDAARRNVGLSSFIAPDQLDRSIRDLETYLRQPFVDASRDEAARWLLDGGTFLT